MAYTGQQGRLFVAYHINHQLHAKPEAEGSTGQDNLNLCLEKIYSRRIAIVTILLLLFFSQDDSDVEVIRDAGESGGVLLDIVQFGDLLSLLR